MTYSSTPTEHTPFVLEGTLAELHTALGSENLLKEIDKHYQSKSVFTGLGAVVGELFGQAANSAMLAMYDGEDTENFACLINDQVVCGTFGGASKLPVGGKVKAVVSREGNVLVAHAILAEQQGYVWIKHAWGIDAEKMANFKIAWWGFLFVNLCWIVSYFLIDTNTTFLENLKFSVLSGGAICFGLAFWANADMKRIAGPATEIFRMLGFVHPEKVNLNSYRYGIVHIHELIQRSEPEHSHHNLFCYKKAIEDGKLTLRLAEENELHTQMQNANSVQNEVAPESRTRFVPRI